MRGNKCRARVDKLTYKGKERAREKEIQLKTGREASQRAV